MAYLNVWKIIFVSCSILQLYESAKVSRPADAGLIKFIELDGQHGHKMIYQSQKLPGILR